MSSNNDEDPDVGQDDENQVTETGTRAGTGAGSRSTPRIAPTDPAGLLSFTKPIPTVTSFFKVAPGNLITFGWNFTYVKATPEALTVLAKCANGYTYPVGPDESGVIPGTATEVIWDIYSYQEAHPNTPLPQAACGMMISDERGLNERQRPGYLSPNFDLQFALYTPQAYKGFADGWECAVCSDASPTFIASHPAAISLLVTALICILSGFHLLRPRHP